MFLKRLALLLLVILAGVVLPGVAQRAGAWSPGPARYGVGVTENVPVRMADGTVLRADVNFPTNSDGSPATGAFPVILTQTPYGKTVGSYSNGAGGVNRYLVSRGYLHVVADVRGTGGSEGSFGLFDPVQAQDGVTLVRWAAALPHSNGKVGLLGLSYLGINQFFTAAAVGPGSPLKAIFPIVAANDNYRDTAFMGGLTNSEFGPGYLGATAFGNILQNAAAGRPVWAPMSDDQPVSGRYQLLMGPWYHNNAGAGIDLNRLELAWFDHWLKGEATGIADTDSPFHAYDMGAKKWVDTTRYPFGGATPTSFFLGNGGALTAHPPAAPAGADPITFTPISNPCRASTDQWAGGGMAAFPGSKGAESPCSSGSPFATQAGPGVLQYTSEPLAEASTVAGPIGVTLFATSTRPETAWVADLEDVDPSGVARPLTQGALLGSFRALDPVRTWTAPDGKPILPYHPSTRAAAQPVVPGEMTRYDIEVFPMFATLPAGHRLRLTLTTADTPHLAPTAPAFLSLLGGAYEVARHAGAASFVEIPLAPAGALAQPCGICR